MRCAYWTLVQYRLHIVELRAVISYGAGIDFLRAHDLISIDTTTKLRDGQASFKADLNGKLKSPAETVHLAESLGVRDAQMQ